MTGPSDDFIERRIDEGHQAWRFAKWGERPNTPSNTKAGLWLRCMWEWGTCHLIGGRFGAVVKPHKCHRRLKHVDPCRCAWCKAVLS